MSITLIPADSRGVANFGWLDSRHSFSFGNYHDSDRMGFGALRVLNDDRVGPGKGFGRHPHENMEIVSIPLSGALRHGDSMGNTQVLATGEVQVMSAGTGLFHDEYNASSDAPVEFLQIWILPQEMGVVPKYDQRAFDKGARVMAFQTLASPDGQEGSLAIGQQAYIRRAFIPQGETLAYSRAGNRNGVYAFLIEGQALIGEAAVGRRDALAILDEDQILISASAGVDILILDVPMG